MVLQEPKTPSSLHVALATGPSKAINKCLVYVQNIGRILKDQGEEVLISSSGIRYMPLDN